MFVHLVKKSENSKNLSEKMQKHSSLGLQTKNSRKLVPNKFAQNKTDYLMRKYAVNSLKVKNIEIEREKQP